MSLKYAVLKRLVKVLGLKRMWTGKSTEELLEDRRRRNARNRIPALKDDAFAISQIEIMGCPVVRMIHKQRTDRANLFLIGGGMISAPRPGAVKRHCALPGRPDSMCSSPTTRSARTIR